MYCCSYEGLHELHKGGQDLSESTNITSHELHDVIILKGILKNCGLYTYLLFCQETKQLVSLSHPSFKYKATHRS